MADTALPRVTYPRLSGTCGGGALAAIGSLPTAPTYSLMERGTG